MNSLIHSRQEIRVELGRREQKEKKRTGSEAPTPHPQLNSVMRPCASAKHIAQSRGSCTAKASESFAAANNLSGYSSKAVFSPAHHQRDCSLGKENAKSILPPKFGHTAEQATGVCINSDKKKVQTHTEQKLDFGTKQKNAVDPFQALISKAQQELEQCASWSRKKMLKEKDGAEDNSQIVLEDTESLALTVRETQENCAKPIQKTVPDVTAQAELEKWKEFGYLLAESYDQLKKNCNKELAESARSKEIIKALKDQIGKLKDLLKHANKENEALRTELASEENIREEFIANRNKLEAALEENKNIYKEKENLLKRVTAAEKEKEFLSNEKTLSEKLVQQLNDKIKVRQLLNRVRNSRLSSAQFAKAHLNI